MNRKLVRFLSVIYGLGFTIPFIYFVFFYPYDKVIEQEKVAYVNRFSGQQTLFERLADKISTCADTSYCACYFYKAHRFDIFNLVDDTTIDWYSQKPDVSRCLYDALDSALQLDVYQVWNNKADSFYRFVISQHSIYWSPSVYVMKQKSDTALHVNGVNSMLRISARVYLKLELLDY